MRAPITADCGHASSLVSSTSESSLLGRSDVITFPPRAAFVYEHLPWLSYYTRHLPGFGGDVKLMRAMGMAQTEKRYNRGSTSKDLFYFLVSPSRKLYVPLSDKS